MSQPSNFIPNGFNEKYPEQGNYSDVAKFVTDVEELHETDLHDRS